MWQLNPVSKTKINKQLPLKKGQKICKQIADLWHTSRIDVIVGFRQAFFISPIDIHSTFRNLFRFSVREKWRRINNSGHNSIRSRELVLHFSGFVLRAQTFTSLMADLRQDINRVFFILQVP